MGLDQLLSVFTYATLLVVLLLVTVCGVAFVFYWLLERQHRFDVNTMSNQDKLLRDSLELNQSLLQELKNNSRSDTQQIYVSPDMNVSSARNPRPYGDELPSASPSIGGD